MNIIEAKKLAGQGKTVISPDGQEFISVDFDDDGLTWNHEYVFGEWREKREPIRFVSSVVHLHEGSWDTAIVYGQQMRELIGETVRITVEVIK